MQAFLRHKVTAKAKKVKEHKLAKESKLAMLKKEDQLVKERKLLKIKKKDKKNYFLYQINAVKKGPLKIKYFYLYLNKIRPLR